MEGRRRIGRKEGDFIQALGLFRQLIQLLNSKSVNSQGQINEPKRKAEPQPIQKRVVNHQPKDQQKEQQKEVRVQRMQKVGLRSWRDWQGLCSQRKQDIFGQYAICFQYQIGQEGGKGVQNPEKGALQSQPFSNS